MATDDDNHHGDLKKKNKERKSKERKKREREKDEMEEKPAKNDEKDGQDQNQTKSDCSNKKKRREKEKSRAMNSELVKEKKEEDQQKKNREKKKKRHREDEATDANSKSIDTNRTAKSESLHDDLVVAEVSPSSSKRKKRQRGNESENSMSKPVNQKSIKDHQSGSITARNNDSHLTYCQNRERGQSFPFDFTYILAPMVGASELAFRLLCRTYGAQLCYTPMMSSTQFVRDVEYRHAELQTAPEDRPLVCHFSANDPQDFAQAAKLVEHQCDAIDLNLGCPQRTAYVGHFGSYLLDPVDRQLVLQIVAAGAKAVSIPIFCKIRLLDTVEDTIELCQQLEEAGAALIAIHARYRATWERTGPGARDGPALLDQVTEIRKHVQIPIITNGNTKTYDDVIQNLQLTQADGIMSAEGILDNPALFLPRFGSREQDGDKLISVIDPLSNPAKIPPPARLMSSPATVPHQQQINDNVDQKKQKRLQKKLREIERIEEKIHAEGQESINQDQKEKLATKPLVVKQLSELEHGGEIQRGNEASARTGATTNTTQSHHVFPNDTRLQSATKTMALRELYDAADDKIRLAHEYLTLARRYPTKIRSIIFHTRRMLKTVLEQFQLLEDLLAASQIEEVQGIVHKCQQYRENPKSFEYDRDKAKRQKEALEKRKHEEGKRKAFEARMMRKAKREGKADLSYYLRQGSLLPTVETITRLRKLSKEEQLSLWKELDHSQHCLAFHLDPYGCKRDNACAFLHVDAKNANTFDESDEVAG